MTIRKNIAAWLACIADPNASPLAKQLACSNLAVTLERLADRVTALEERGDEGARPMEVAK